ncbi:MAG: nuclear transport factor 2 family protein [Cyclobacteriaceae bacterium]
MIKIVFLFCTLISISVFGQDSKVHPIENHVSELMNAMVNAEESKLHKMTSKSLSYGHSNGLIENQSEFIAALTSGISNFTDIDVQNQTVERIGKIALVRHRLVAKTRNKGASPANIDLGVLMVWQKKGKSWKLLARQAFKN